MSRAARFAFAATACAVLAAWMTFSYTGAAARKAGPTRRVAVAARPLQRGEVIGADDVSAISERSIPQQFAPPDSLDSAEDAVGERVQANLPAGAYLTKSLLAGGGAEGSEFKLRKGERGISVDVVVSPAGSELAAGGRVDLYASGYGGDQRTQLLIAGAEILSIGDGQSSGKPRITLRLASAQVGSVIRADVFAHELRAVVAGQ